ncbi:prolyl aminopeptidase [Saccharopolyspora gloriosae]|uniref:Proline iminopeptidase n=1 Tax=Saccharopolyspora gloriosae TaxID=455344 RepID=A0A840NCS1_9PSEU|nr:prolyl aminopeptidase [Saccharopolyspora gloriosae]MBB5067032.1 proline iminopeptidase [Saccharopolyspora gloriosae]
MYPEIEPHASGLLDVGDGHSVHWECCGNPDGKPVVVLHGGPGSGCTPGWRRYFDPDAYRIVLFDQRGCGRSTPLAGEPGADLATNTTHHLLADVELLRDHLGVERWMVFGGSWGSTLGLAYAQRNPERVTELVLFSVCTTTHREVEWITQDMARVFPEQWDRFRAGVPEAERDGRLVDAYDRLLHAPDPAVRARAARDWCRWEEAHVEVGHARPDSRYDDPDFRMTFARLVTHYWRHGAWFEDGELLRGAQRLAGIPGVLVHGRRDVSSPPDIAWRLARAWPDADLRLIDDAGHGGGAVAAELVAVTDRFAAG